MATLTIKNLPNQLYERLRAQAKWHRRSINSEAIDGFVPDVDVRSPATGR